MDETRSCFFDELNTTYKLLAILSKKERDDTHNPCWYKKTSLWILCMLKGLENIMKFYANRFDSMHEMCTFLERYK